jgi:hypothetical protein
MRRFFLPSLLLAAACSAPSADDSAPTETGSAALGAVQAFGPYIADVTAAGNGCPAGSWNAAVSDDGLAFTLTFSAYEVKVAPGQLVDVKQCVVNVAFRDVDGQPMSFSFGQVVHQGYAFLDRGGMRAARRTSYVFSANGKGIPGATPSQTANIPGPISDSWLQADDVFPAGVWSPCAAVSNLVVGTSLMLQNDSRKSGSGYINTSTVDGAMTLDFELAWRRC